MNEIALSIANGDVSLPATLSLPAPSTPIRGGLVPLHPADDPSRDQFLFRQLADILPQRGIAVLRFDRRAPPKAGDVPLESQASDALAALRILRQQPGVGNAPLGLWGFSQGAWAAPLAASHSPDEVNFLTLVASAGVSPARQMRYGTAEQLRRAGYGADAQAELAQLRITWESYQRGQLERAPAQVIIDAAAQQPWFSLAWVRRELPPPGSWEDMDFDPAPIFAGVRCPVLLFYGEDDEWVPVDESITAWRQAAAVANNTDVTIVRLPGSSHHPTLHGGRTIDTISPLYTTELLTWLENHLTQRASR